VRGRAASVAAVASLLLIAAGCIAAAAQKERHQLGTNWVRPVEFVVDQPPGQQLCQAGMRLPAGTGGIGLRIGTYHRVGPDLELTIRAAGADPVRGRLPSGWREGDIVVPVPVLGAERRDARVCLEHRGGGRLAIAGGPGVGVPARLGGDDVAGMIRLEYVEPVAKTWFPVVPKLFDRLAVARDALPAQASLALFALLAAVVLGGALLLVVREGSR
jgi:hypothetical protein